MSDSAGFLQWTRLRHIPAALAVALALLFGAQGLAGAADSRADPSMQDRAGPAAPDQAGLLPAKVAWEIAQYAEGGAGEVWRVLGRLGYPDAQALAAKNDLSPTLLLQSAYGAVEKTEKNAGASFLSAFVHVVAESVPAILHEPRLARFVRAHPTTRRSFTFAGPPGAAVATAADPSIRRVISLIVDITASRGSPISPLKLMERKLGLSKEAVLNEILLYASAKDALADKLSLLPQPPQKEKLADIAREIFDAIPASRSNRQLAEAIFRWSGLQHPTLGEWFRYRDQMIDLFESGRSSGSPRSRRAAMGAATQIRTDMAAMSKAYADLGHRLDAPAIERMFFEYAQRQPEAAALWGFAVISLKKDLDFERYVPDEIDKAKRRFAKYVLDKAGAKVHTSDDIASVMRSVSHEDESKFEREIRRHGPKPHHGYHEYCRLTGFAAPKASLAYFSTRPVQDAVGRVCPTELLR